MELSKQDIKLISYIYQAGREPISKIAKECKLSREQINYKIKKFQDQGLLKKFITFFNYPALGYNLLSIALIKSKNKIEFKKIKNIINYSEIIGNYDYFVNFISKDEFEMKQILQNILQENPSIEEIKLINPYFAENFPLKFIDNKQTFKINEKFEKHELSKEEIKILKILENDARIKITEIASKLNISAELALYKLKNLQKKKIILGTKAYFDITKLGFHYSLVIIDLNKFSKETEDKIKKFSQENKFINSLVLSMNSPEITIQLFNKTQEELEESIQEIKNVLKNEIKSLEIMFPQQEKEINTLPFLE